MHSRKKKNTVDDRGRTVTVLSVEPAEEHRAGLENIFARSSWGLCPSSNWKLSTTSNVRQALSAIRDGDIPIVLCESDIAPSTWKGFLEELRQLPNPPLLIVTSRLADEQLWAEALNLGAYDVLAKPYDSAEVIRVVSLAWLHWEWRHPVASAQEIPRLAAAMGA